MFKAFKEITPATVEELRAENNNLTVCIANKQEELSGLQSDALALKDEIAELETALQARGVAYQAEMDQRTLTLNERERELRDSAAVMEKIELDQRQKQLDLQAIEDMNSDRTKHLGEQASKQNALAQELASRSINIEKAENRLVEEKSALKLREDAFKQALQDLELKVREITSAESAVSIKQAELQMKLDALGAQDRDFSTIRSGLSDKEKSLSQREQAVNETRRMLDKTNNDLAEKAALADSRTKAVEEREDNASAKDQELRLREANLVAAEKELKISILQAA